MESRWDLPNPPPKGGSPGDSVWLIGNFRASITLEVCFHHGVEADEVVYLQKTGEGTYASFQTKTSILLPAEDFSKARK